MADVIERIIFDDSKALPALNNITNAIKETDKAMVSLNEETKKVSESIGKDVIKTNEQIAESTKKTAEVERKALRDKIEATNIYGTSLGALKDRLNEYRTNLINVIKVMTSYIALSKTQEEGVNTLSNLFYLASRSIIDYVKNFNLLRSAINIKTTLKDLGASFVQTGKDMVTSLSNPKEAAINLFNSIKSGIAGVPTLFTNLGKSIKESYKNMDGAAVSTSLFTKGLRGAVVGLNLLKVGIAATGIGALIIGLTSLISFFTRTQKGADFLSRTFAGLRTGVAVLGDVFSKIGEKIFDALSNPKQAAKDLYETIKENLINRLQAVPQFFVALGKTIGNSLTLNFDEAGKSAKEAGRAFIQFTTGLDTEQQKAFGDQIKDTANAMKQAAIEAANLERRKQALADAQIRLTREEANMRSVIAANKKEAEDTNNTYIKRIEAAKKAIGTEQSLLSQKLKLAQENVNIIKAEQSLTENMRADYEALAQAEAEVSNLKAESLEKQIELNNKINGLYKEYNDAINTTKDALFEIAKAYNLITNQEEFEFVKEKQINELEKMLTLFEQGAVIGADFTKEINLVNAAIEGLKTREYFDANVAAIKEFKAEIKGIAIDIPKIDPKQIIPTRKSWEEQFMDFLEGVETSGDLFNKVIDELFSFNDGQKIKGFTSGLKEFVTVFGGILNEATEIQLSNIDKQLDKLSKRREKLEEDLSREQELYEKGLANNLSTKEQEVNGLIAEEGRLAAERDKLQRESQRRQILAETAQQTQSLITSSIQIIKGFSNIPIVGLPLGIAAVASLFGFFAKTKVDALKATKLYKGADRIDDYFGVPNRFGRSDIGNQKGYRLIDEDNGERTNVIISAREMLIPEKIANQQRVFFENLRMGLYDGFDLSSLISKSQIQKGIGVTNINHSHVVLPKQNQKVRQYVTFTGKDGVQRAVLKTITEDMKDGTVIEFGY